MNHEMSSKWTRRDFIKSTVTSVAGLAALPGVARSAVWKSRGAAEPATIALVKTHDRKQGVRDVMKLLDVPSPEGQRVLVKPNFNTADPAPGSTHNDTLEEIVRELKERDARSITLGERSGPPETRKVMEEKGIPDMAAEFGFNIVDFETIEESDWVPFNPPGSHWEGGLFLPRPILDSDYVLSTCCLKTHAYGGVFTMSLKLAVGMTPKNLMRQLHRSPDMRRMIAEINAGYHPKLVIMDGVEAFVDGGPSDGKKVDAGVFLAGSDRVALDAVGLAVLKDLGSNSTIMDTNIFDQEQIRRAVELGLGVGRPDLIKIVTGDEASRAYAEHIQSVLKQG